MGHNGPKCRRRNGKALASTRNPLPFPMSQNLAGQCRKTEEGPISVNAACATLVFDGDCAICRSWVSYWQRLTNGRVIYRPYHDAATDFPTIPREAFERAIWLIEPDGRVYSGAAAAYRVLLYAPGHGAWWWMYTHVPGFAAASEWAYTFFARRRDLLSRATPLLWGPVLE